MRVFKAIHHRNTAWWPNAVSVEGILGKQRCSVCLLDAQDWGKYMCNLILEHRPSHLTGRLLVGREASGVFH